MIKSSSSSNDVHLVLASLPPVRCLQQTAECSQLESLLTAASCCCLARAGAMMVGDTLFRSADGSSHCPICRGKVRSSAHYSMQHVSGTTAS
jgi:hypothetical protein